MHQRPARHPLEALVDHVAAVVEAEEHPAEMAVWAVAALAAKLGLPVLIGDDAVGNALCNSADGPRYAAEVVLHDLDDIYLESGDVLDRAEAIKRVGGAWVGVVENLMDRHPEQREDLLRSAYRVVQRLVDGVRERGLSARSRRRPRSHPARCESSS